MEQLQQPELWSSDAETYRRILDDAPGLICTFLPDSTLTYVNEAYCKYFDLTPEELLGGPFLDFLPDEATRQAAMVEYSSLTHERPVATYEHAVSAPDGSIRWQRWTDRAFFDDQGDISYFHAIGEDITESKATEEQIRQMQKLDSIGRLAGGIAHDFNNIIMVMQGYLSQITAEAAGFPEKFNEALEELDRATERAAGLTRQLLMFSRKQVMHLGCINVSATIENISKMFDRILGEDIDLELECDTDGPSVRADAGQIEQVLMNLVVNARDAMPDGGRLTIGTVPVEIGKGVRYRNPEARPGRFVCISVSDTGVGIPADALEHLFEPFYTTKRQGEGTGLGLPTVYGIIKQHDGWVEVDSRVGAGTTFRFYLPVDEKDAAGPQDRRVDFSKLPNGQGKVLFAEDDEAVRKVIVTALKRYGYTVLGTDSAAKALKDWRERSGEIDLLLTDIVMPGGVSGTRLAKELLERNPSLKVILMSGYNPDPEFGEWMKDNEIAFLEKPFVPARLIETLRESLSG